jgi:hypothetical protein
MTLIILKICGLALYLRDGGMSPGVCRAVPCCTAEGRSMHVLVRMKHARSTPYKRSIAFVNGYALRSLEQLGRHTSQHV